MSTNALERAAATPGIDTIMVAGRLTLVEQSALLSAIPMAQRNGMEVVAAGVLNSGLLVENYPSSGSRYEYGPVPPAVLEKARRIAAVCARLEIDLPTAAMQYPLTVPGVTSIVLGSGRPAQIVDSVRRMREPIPEGLWSALSSEGLIR